MRDKLQIYESDDRMLFCRHCGRAAWRHFPTKHGLICDHSPAILKAKEQEHEGRP